MQRNANMLKILKKVSFADFMGFFAKMQSPVCPPNELLSFGKISQYTMYRMFTKFQMSVKKTLHRKVMLLQWISITDSDTQELLLWDYCQFAMVPFAITKHLLLVYLKVIALAV